MEVKQENVTIPHAQISPGSIVSFSFDFQSRKSIPSNPIVFRVRNDLSWEIIMKTNSQKGNNQKGNITSFISIINDQIYR